MSDSEVKWNEGVARSCQQGGGRQPAGAITESWFSVSVGDKIGLGDISFWSYYSFKR